VLISVNNEEIRINQRVLDIRAELRFDIKWVPVFNRDTQREFAMERMDRYKDAIEFSSKFVSYYRKFSN
jgi:hypothetical protein